MLNFNCGLQYRLHYQLINNKRQNKNIFFILLLLFQEG